MDGRIFWGYLQKSSGGEYWKPADVFLAQREKSENYAKRRRATPGYNEERSRKRRERLKNDPSHRAQMIASRNRHRLDNREKINRQKRKWHRDKYYADPVFRKEHIRKGTESAKRIGQLMYNGNEPRRRRLRAQKHPERNEDILLSLYHEASSMALKTGVPHDMDHIIPISRGGWHHEKNVQALPVGVNRSKHHGAFWLSDEYLDFRDVPEFLWPEKLKPYYYLMLRIFGHPLKKLAETA